MDVERLRLLREVAERGSVTAAASAAALTPSAVSQQLKILAREAKVPLLERSGRGVRLTDAGMALVRRTDDVLAALAAAREEMAAYRSGPRGHVRVAMFPTGAAMFLPELIRRAGERGIEIGGRDPDRPVAEVLEMLADVDLVVVHQDERDRPVDTARLRATELLREPLEVLLPPGHRLGGQEAVDFGDLASESWISVEDGFMIDDALTGMAKASGFAARVVQRVNDFRVTEELVLAGVGVALIPRFVRLARPLVRRPIQTLSAARRISVVQRIEATPRPAVEETVGILRAIGEDIVARVGSDHARTESSR
jgi:DNA-binding transcriptional LysR family regulator